MFKWPMPALAAVAIALHPTEGKAQQEIETVFALPSQTMTFTAQYVAQDAGLFQDQGLKVTDRYLGGVASPNAVLAGGADFTATTAFFRMSSSAQARRRCSHAGATSGDLSRPRASC